MDVFFSKTLAMATKTPMADCVSRSLFLLRAPAIQPISKPTKRKIITTTTNNSTKLNPRRKHSLAIFSFF